MQEWSKKYSTPLPVYNALLPPGMPYSAVPNHSSRLLLLLLLFALLLLRFLLLLKLLPLTDIVREELEKFVEHNSSLSAYLLHFQPIEPLAPSPTSEQKTEETE